MWNARGISDEKLALLSDPEFTENADLLLITETWLEPLAASPNIPGFICIHRPKHVTHHKARRPSGGIAIFIRTHLAPFTSHWRPQQHCTHMWLHIKAAIGLPRDLYLCLP